MQAATDTSRFFIQHQWVEVQVCDCHSWGHLDRVILFLFPDIFMLVPPGSWYQLHGQKRTYRCHKDVQMGGTSHVSVPDALRGRTFSVPHSTFTDTTQVVGLWAHTASKGEVLASLLDLCSYRSRETFLIHWRFAGVDWLVLECYYVAREWDFVSVFFLRSLILLGHYLLWHHLCGMWYIKKIQESTIRAGFQYPLLVFLYLLNSFIIFI